MEFRNGDQQFYKGIDDRVVGWRGVG